MILTYGDSKIGLVRKLNEDAIDLSVPSLFILADGMGGYAGGQIASHIAVEQAAGFFTKDTEKTFSEASLKESVLCANEAILKEKKDNPNLSSMGTTMVMAAISQDTLYWAHVGDSRLYVMDEGQLSQITVDHSFVMELVTEGKISKEEMRFHPRKNEITRAVGIDDILKVDTGHLTLKKGDFVLLCSDGLSGMVEDETIQQVLLECPGHSDADLKKTGERLMDLVYEAGARDNVSIILGYFKD